jgi:APA family basic amino acid/polyamine antiporter
MSPVRQLGLVSATALVVANMIGMGVFTTSGFLLADLKSPWLVLAVWVAGGVLAALGALCYGALARRLPESGGEYLFLSRTLHPAAGYVAGWISLLVGFSAPLAGAAFAFGEYAKPWLPGLNPRWSGTLLLLVFAVVHANQVRRGAWIQNWTVLVKIILITGFILVMAPRLPDAAGVVSITAPSALPWSALAVSLVWVSFSYAGWNAAVYIGSEIKRPEVNLPRALLLGTALVTVLYLALNTIFVFAAPINDLAGQLAVGRIAAAALGGPVWGEVVAVIVSLALVSSVSSMIMAGPRVYAQMAVDGYLPAWLATREGPPRGAIALQAVLALVMLWSAAYDSLLTYIGFTLSLSTAATVVGLVRLRMREGEAFKMVGWPWVPACFLAGVAWMALFSVFRRPWESCIGLATIGLGGIVWIIHQRQNRSRR